MSAGRYAVLVLAILACPAPAASQTRAEIAQQARAEKAKTLRPYQPNKAEQALFLVEDRRLVERIFNPPNGLFVRVGGLPQGSGMPVGPGYRRSNDVASVMGYGVLAPMTGYWDVGGELSFNHLLNHRAFLAVGARHMNLPKEDFFGMGINSLKSNQTSYALEQSVFTARGGSDPLELFSVAGRVSYETPRQGPGEDTRFPSIEDVFTPSEAPGLFQDTDFLRTGVTFTVDVTDRPLGPRSGGMYIFDVERFWDRELRQFSFSQWTVDLRQFVPIVQGARSLVMRVFATGVRPDAGNDVPYYHTPTLGGAYMVRGLANYRFRDRNVVFTNVEYHYELNAFMTGVVFYDAGTVAPTFKGLAIDNIQWDWGFGVRFGFMGMGTMRTEMSFGAEGPRFVFKFNDIF